MPLGQIRSLFAVAGVYDFLIGLTFLLAGPQLYAASGIAAPNHWAYVQFAALLLMIFGLMFFQVARDPVAHRQLIPYGMLLKLSYVALAGFYWATAGIPRLYQPFVIIDAIMLVLFVWAYQACQRLPGTSAVAHG